MCQGVRRRSFSNRKNQYSTHTAGLYKILGSRERLKCIAIISYRESTKRLFDLEIEDKNIFKEDGLPLALFKELDEAVDWAKGILENI